MQWYKYNNFKDLWLYAAKMPDVNISELSCSSFFDYNGEELPEADDFKMFPLHELKNNACNSMKRLLENGLENDISIFYDKLYN